MIAESPYPVIDDDPAIQDAYVAMRENGQSHKMAEMLATRSAPGLKTDTRFAARLDANADVPARYRRMAKAAGVVTDGKQYMRQLAAFPGDPQAWVGGSDDVKRVCKHRGWGCDGAVDMKPVVKETPDDKPYTVAESIVDQEMALLSTKDYGMVSTPKKRKALREYTRERLSGRG
jgi:hypothetical protein